MPLTLVGLHGYSQKGSMLREALLQIDGLSSLVDVVCPDGPHPCKPESVQRLYTVTGQPVPPRPHLSWWDASDDGAIYHGFDTTRDLLAAEVSRHECAALLGFSQGAILAAALAAMSAAGQFPPLAFVIFVAARTPRAHALQPLFAAPIEIPSLHIIGARDLMTPPPLAHSLAEKFDRATRNVHEWPGPHVIPTRGPAAAAIVDYVRAASR